MRACWDDEHWHLHDETCCPVCQGQHRRPGPRATRLPSLLADSTCGRERACRRRNCPAERDVAGRRLDDACRGEQPHKDRAVLLEQNDECQLQHRYMQVEGMAGLVPPTINDQATPRLPAQITPRPRAPWPPNSTPKLHQLGGCYPALLYEGERLTPRQCPKGGKGGPCTMCDARASLPPRRGVG